MQNSTQLNLWQGREDSEDGERGLRWHQVMNTKQEKQNCALVGFCCDLGVAANKGRVGAKDGPNVIRSALANLAWHAKCNIYDAGNVVAQSSLEQVQTEYAQQITKSLMQDAFVVGLGGGHEIAWGTYQGLAQHVAGKSQRKKIGIINFDAHFDLRKPAPQASSGTPFRQIAEQCHALGHTFHYACIGIAEPANTQALFDYAKSSNTQYLLDVNCHLSAAKDVLIPMLKEVDIVYVTVCLDVFSASAAPGVSAPSTLGITTDLVIKLIHWLASSQEDYGYLWQIADIAEMNPLYDIDARTAKLAARIVFEMLKAKFPG